MNEKNAQKKFKWWIVLLIAAVLAVSTLLLTKCNGAKAEEKIEVADETLDIDDVRIVSVNPYSGAYWEDGSDAPVKNIMSVTLTNTGKSVIQLATLTLMDQNGKAYGFQFTSLWPGKTMTVLEQNCAVCEEEQTIVAADLSEVVRFEEEPTLCGDVLAIGGMENAIMVKNISGNAISGGRVFYKNEVDGVLQGGITYMVTVPALEKDGEITIPTGHFSLDSSKLLFATYVQ